jgi:hypothetical protein
MRPALACTAGKTLLPAGKKQEVEPGSAGDIMLFGGA